MLMTGKTDTILDVEGILVGQAEGTCGAAAAAPGKPR